MTRVSGNAGRLSVAGIACLKPGQPGRFFYRVRLHRRRNVIGVVVSLVAAGH